MNQRFFAFLQNLFSNMASVDLHLIAAPFSGISAVDRRFRTGMEAADSLYQPFRELCLQARHGIFYIVTDSFFMRYILFRPDAGSEDVLSVGPYAGVPADEAFFSEITRIHSLSFSVLEQIQDFFYNLPVFDDNLMLIASLTTALEYIAPDCPGFGLEYRNLAAQPGNGATVTFHEDFDEQISNTEERYKAEQELLDCIARGDSEHCAPLLRKFRSYSFSPRIDDTLREKKNLSYTANAMYRKAAQAGAVHPYHLHRLSSRYAQSIEQCTSVSQIEQMGEKMARDYCLLVKNKSVRSYSPVIQQALNYIDFHISGSLSLSAVAAKMNISPPYLSGLFKKEMGITLTDYVNSQRISASLKLLLSTDMQIQNIAAHVGIADVNYFTKLFKKQLGCTPRDYRNRFH